MTNFLKVRRKRIFGKVKGETTTIQRYKDVPIIYGDRGRRYAEALSKRLTTIYPIQVPLINECILPHERKTHPRKNDLYDIFCAILYLLKEGCT